MSIHSSKRSFFIHISTVLCNSDLDVNIFLFSIICQGNNSVIFYIFLFLFRFLSFVMLLIQEK